MLEFLVALLIFSTGLLGLMTGQLAGKRASHDALQRSMATVLLRDVLTRIRANPAQVAAYHLQFDGGEGAQAIVPANNCDSSSCNAAQLAAFDLWQWQDLLQGAVEYRGQTSTGGLLLPMATIDSAGPLVRVTISWCAILLAHDTGQGGCQGAMGELEKNADIGSAALRRQVSMSTHVWGP